MPNAGSYYVHNHIQIGLGPYTGPLAKITWLCARSVLWATWGYTITPMQKSLRVAELWALRLDHSARECIPTADSLQNSHLYRCFLWVFSSKKGWAWSGLVAQTKLALCVLLQCQCWWSSPVWKHGRSCAKICWKLEKLMLYPILKANTAGGNADVLRIWWRKRPSFTAMMSSGSQGASRNMRLKMPGYAAS